MKMVVADPLGGPENLKLVDAPAPQPGPGEMLIELKAIGVNFIDVYFRSGLYKAPESPVKLGNEGAGVVAEAGPGVSFRKGQRVAYVMSRGSYAEFAVVPEANVVELPPAVSFESGAAAMLQGLTAHYLTRSTFPLNSKHVCLIHAAAGGAGLLTVQLAKIAGATVIGTCSTAEKAERVKSHGADHVILYSQSDFVAETKQITRGAGVDVVYDSVGAATFAKSLDCLRPRGMMVSFGQSSGPVGQIDPLTLMQKGSLFLTRPTLVHHMSDRSEYEARAADIFGWVASGQLRLSVYRDYPLAAAAEAHRALESRASTGKVLLHPS